MTDSPETQAPAEPQTAEAQTAEAQTAEPQAAEPQTALPSYDDVEEALRDVVDPELGINVVDLGLVYGLEVGDDAAAKIDMTLTSAACPLQDVIEDQVEGVLVKSGLCTEVDINWVWIPPWGPDKITDDGREQLRALGFTV